MNNGGNYTLSFQLKYFQFSSTYAKEKNLGEWSHAHFSFADHVSTICRSIFIHLCEPRSIRQFVSPNSASLVWQILLSVAALITAKLKWCQPTTDFNFPKTQHAN